MTAPDIPPGPGFVATVAATTGIHRTEEGIDLARLLITHPGPRRAGETTDTVEAGMRRLATALHLGPGSQPPPLIGPQLMIRRANAALDYGHDQYVMTIPAPRHEWLTLVQRGAMCRVCLIITPLPLTAGTAETDAHLRVSLDRGAVMWGTTYLRRRI